MSDDIRSVVPGEPDHEFPFQRESWWEPTVFVAGVMALTILVGLVLQQGSGEKNQAGNVRVEERAVAKGEVLPESEVEGKSVASKSGSGGGGVVIVRGVSNIGPSNICSSVVVPVYGHTFAPGSHTFIVPSGVLVPSPVAPGGMSFGFYPRTNRFRARRVFVRVGRR